MPHATNEVSQPLVNGDVKNSSKTLSHISSYPVVSDGIETFKSNPYGKKSLDLVDGAYSRVEPYLETPKQYVIPYAKKADELADSGLSRVDATFPIVKEDTNTVVEKSKALAYWPFQLAGDGKDYVVNTYFDEYNKTKKHHNRGPGVSTFIMAILSTELKIASDFFQVVADFLGPKYHSTKDQAKQLTDQAIDQAVDTTAHYKQKGEEVFNDVKEGKLDLGKKVEEYQKQGEQKASEYKKAGEEKAEQGKQEAQKTKEEAQKKVQKN